MTSRFLHPRYLVSSLSLCRFKTRHWNRQRDLTAFSGKLIEVLLESPKKQCAYERRRHSLPSIHKPEPDKVVTEQRRPIGKPHSEILSVYALNKKSRIRSEALE